MVAESIIITCIITPNTVIFWLNIWVFGTVFWWNWVIWRFLQTESRYGQYRITDRNDIIQRVYQIGWTRLEIRFEFMACYVKSYMNILQNLAKMCCFSHLFMTSGSYLTFSPGFAVWWEAVHHIIDLTNTRSSPPDQLSAVNVLHDDSGTTLFLIDHADFDQISDSMHIEWRLCAARRISMVEMSQPRSQFYWSQLPFPRLARPEIEIKSKFLTVNFAPFGPLKMARNRDQRFWLGIESWQNQEECRSGWTELGTKECQRNCGWCSGPCR